MLTAQSHEMKEKMEQLGKDMQTAQVSMLQVWECSTQGLAEVHACPVHVQSQRM